MKTHTVTIVAFKGFVNEIYSENPYIVTYNLEYIPIELIECNKCFYEGTVTKIPKDVYTDLVEILEKKDNQIENILGTYVTICMLVNDNVLFLDMLYNADNFMEHPLNEMGKAYLIREKLDNLYPSKKLKYLSQSKEWYKKQKAYYMEHKKSIENIKRQVELLHLLNNYTK